MLKDERQLVSYFADQITNSLVKKSIKIFQKWRITLSESDTGLVSTWDEICVQIQNGYSFHWDDYEDGIECHLKSEIQKLNDYERFALWLQSDQGMFYDKIKKPENIEGDIMEYLKSRIFEKAGSWSNKRIRKHLERG